MIRAVEITKVMGLNATRHTVAKSIKSFSRRTAYSVMNKMIEKGILECEINTRGDKVLSVSDIGESLIDRSLNLI